MLLSCVAVGYCVRYVMLCVYMCCYVGGVFRLCLWCRGLCMVAWCCVVLCVVVLCCVVVCCVAIW